MDGKKLDSSKFSVIYDNNRAVLETDWNMKINE